MNELLIITIVIVLLVLVLTFLLSFIVKRTNRLMKDIFTDRISEFDYLIGDKERKVDELNDDIQKKTEMISQLEEKTKENEKNSVTNEDVLLPKMVGYESDNLLSNYKIIKEKFNFDPTKVLDNFIKENAKHGDDDYYIYKKVRSYFTFDVVYRISMYQADEQYEIVTSLLDNRESEVLKKIINKNTFDIKKLIETIDNMTVKLSPEIKVLVGDQRYNYNYLDKNIVTEYDNKITEGFKVVYRGIIYDYSI